MKYLPVEVVEIVLLLIFSTDEGTIVSAFSMRPYHGRISAMRLIKKNIEHHRVHPNSGSSTLLKYRDSASFDDGSFNNISSVDFIRPHDHFNREATKSTKISEPCILKIHESYYNLTAWANAHPGGAKVLLRFHDKDASKAFDAVGHSAQAHEMLKDFLINREGVASGIPGNDYVPEKSHPIPATKHRRGAVSRIRHKLFTREDPIGLHKYLGIFCLLNFIGRYRQMLFQDPAAGLGSRGLAWFSFTCLFLHATLSLSSLIFHTVPKERVVGKPMIWQEYRVHNIIFGMRSVLTAMAASIVIKAGNAPKTRVVATTFSAMCVLAANTAADIATDKLRAVATESTTATMPYWNGCSIETQKRFKGFYAYCQFMASLACLAAGNPAWPLAVLLPIQLASLLMTLVRKGLISARMYHLGYTASLIAPWFVGMRSMLFTKTPDFAIMAGLAYLLFKLRRRGVSKYAIWMPTVLFRIGFGDFFINYKAW